ncbi:MAG: AAA family ATPase [Patescibacteria group bacterium]
MNTPNASIDLASAGERFDLDTQFSKEGNGMINTYPTPWPTLTRVGRCLRPGTDTIIAGPAKHGKSYFAMTIALRIHRSGVPWRYLPLEDRRLDFARRMLCLITGSWEPLRDEQETAPNRQQALNMNRSELNEIMQNVLENPMLPQGKDDVPDLRHKTVTDFIREASKVAKVIIVDPIAQIDFDTDGQKSWQAERKFIQRIGHIAAETECCPILLAHTVKRQGSNRGASFASDDIQGSSALTRLSHNSLILEAHDARPDLVRGDDGTEMEGLLHNRTLHIAAVRNGMGTGMKLAYNLGCNSPIFEELGIILPPKKKEKKA